MRKATDAQIVLAYQQEKSVYRAAGLLGMRGSSVHERLKKLGVSCEGNGRPWNKRDSQMLQENYHQFADDGQLADLAKAMGRTKHFICRKAGELGLTNPSRDKRTGGKWKYMSEDDAISWMEKLSTSKLGINAFMHRYRLGGGWSYAMRERFPGDWDILVESRQSKSTKYQLGRAVEYATIRKLEKVGYYALRSPASRGAVDVIALRLGEVCLVNCKRNIFHCPPADWNRTFDLAISIGGIPIMAGRIPGKRGVQFKLMAARKSGKRGDSQPFGQFDLVEVSDK